jgi:cytochrome c biogenesis protein CcmG/thiol:disulfide interchange protein DsbE
MKSLSRSLGLALAVLILAAAACSPTQSGAARKVKQQGDRKLAPDFALKDVNGATVRLSDYRGKVVLLNFWATWCGPCKIEIPWFIEFEQKHKDRGFAVLGISMDDGGWEVVRPFLARMNVNYRTLMGDETVAELYGGVASLPTSFLIDREGRIASAHLGLVSKSVYENEIEQLLAAPGAQGSAADAAVRLAGGGANQPSAER